MDSLLIISKTYKNLLASKMSLCCGQRNSKIQFMAWNVPVCNWLPKAISKSVPLCHFASPHPLCSSTASPPFLSWAHVCFCSLLQPAWLTMMILTKLMERSRLDRQIASEQSALSLCANSVSSLSLSPSLHLFSFRHLCVYLRGDVCHGGLAARRG